LCEYRMFKICGVAVLAHKVVWWFHCGSWPTYGIDHRNGDGTDNRIGNLRDVPQSVNMKNKSRYRTGRTLPVGIYAGRCRRDGTCSYRAQCGVNGKVVKLSFVETIEQALAMRAEMLSLHGYSERHGEEK
jgi:hypothetical protein